MWRTDTLGRCTPFSENETYHRQRAYPDSYSGGHFRSNRCLSIPNTYIRYMQVDYDVSFRGSIHKHRFAKNCKLRGQEDGGIKWQRQVFVKAPDSAFDCDDMRLFPTMVRIIRRASFKVNCWKFPKHSPPPQVTNALWRPIDAIHSRTKP